MIRSFLTTSTKFSDSASWLLDKFNASSNFFFSSVNSFSFTLATFNAVSRLATFSSYDFISDAKTDTWSKFFLDSASASPHFFSKVLNCPSSSWILYFSASSNNSNSFTLLSATSILLLDLWVSSSSSRLRWWFMLARSSCSAHFPIVAFSSFSRSWCCDVNSCIADSSCSTLSWYSCFLSFSCFFSSSTSINLVSSSFIFSDNSVTSLSASLFFNPNKFSCCSSSTFFCSAAANRVSSSLNCDFASSADAVEARTISSSSRFFWVAVWATTPVSLWRSSKSFNFCSNSLLLDRAWDKRESAFPKFSSESFSFSSRSLHKSFICLALLEKSARVASSSSLSLIAAASSFWISETCASLVFKADSADSFWFISSWSFNLISSSSDIFTRRSSLVAANWFSTAEISSLILDSEVFRMSSSLVSSSIKPSFVESFFSKSSTWDLKSARSPWTTESSVAVVRSASSTFWLSAILSFNSLIFSCREEIWSSLCLALSFSASRSLSNSNALFASDSAFKPLCLWSSSNFNASSPDIFNFCSNSWICFREFSKSLLKLSNASFTATNSLFFASWVCNASCKLLSCELYFSSDSTICSFDFLRSSSSTSYFSSLFSSFWLVSNTSSCNLEFSDSRCFKFPANLSISSSKSLDFSWASNNSLLGLLALLSEIVGLSSSTNAVLAGGVSSPSRGSFSTFINSPPREFSSSSFLLSFATWIASPFITCHKIWETMHDYQELLRINFNFSMVFVNKINCLHSIRYAIIKAPIVDTTTLKWFPFQPFQNFDSKE